MTSDLTDFVICPNCGSTEYMADYPIAGQKLCLDCGHESTRIKLKTVETVDTVSEDCPFCGKKYEEDDTLLEDEYKGNGIEVYKCKGCGKLDGYLYINPPDDYYDEPDERQYKGKAIKIAKQEGKFIHPSSKYRELEKALRKKEKSPVEKCKKQLTLLVQRKIREMNSAGISYETIGRAKCEAQYFIEKKGPLTSKKLNSLFPAALLLVQSSDLIRFGKTFRKKVSERQLERMFDTTRKTIRKWEKNLTTTFL